VPARKGRTRRYITLMSLILVVSFTNLSMSPSYMSLGSGSSVPCNLHPQIMSKPILDEVILDKGMLGFIVMEEVRQNPDILISGRDFAYNLFSDLGSKTVRIFFKNVEELQFDSMPESDQPNKILVVPCSVEGRSYNAHILLYGDGQIKSAVYSLEEYDKICEELKGRLSSGAVARMLEKLDSHGLQGKDAMYFIDATDESVRSVMAFLEKIGAESIKRRFQEIVESRKLLLIGQPVFVAGAIAVKEAKDEKSRAQAILENMLIKEGIIETMFKGAFESFWGLWKKNQTEKFRLDEIAPQLGLTIREIERKSEDVSNEGYPDNNGNRGIVQFNDTAYGRVSDVIDIELSDCTETIKDIKRIFREVALHEIREHNDKGGHRLSEDDADVPGIDPRKIKICRLSNCLLPTDLVMTEVTETEKGKGYRAFKEIRINEYFVRVMQKLRKPLLEENLGKILLDESCKEKYPSYVPVSVIAEREESAELYYSIIYALAIHTIRGHFPINEYGFVVFNPDEFLAQKERGKKYLYVNVVALMFYWIAIVERDTRFEERIEYFMENYPEIFAGLTNEEKEKLPWDVLQIAANIVFRGEHKWRPTNWWEAIPSGITAEHVEKVFRDNPDAVSNEGEPGTGVLPPGALAKAFQLLHLEGKARTAEDIVERMRDLNVSIVSGCLDALVEFGLVKTDLKEGEKTYEPEFITPARKEEVIKILEANNTLDRTDVKKVKGEIYKVKETLWADAILDALVQGSRAQEIRAKGEKIILALETDWIPEEQKALIQQLIQELDRLDAKGTVKVIRGDGDTLATNLMKTVEEERAPLQNVIVLASQDTLKNKEFDPIRATGDNDTDKAFLAGVDASGLKGDSYIRLLEMLTMAVRMALGQRSISGHPEIEVTIENARTVIFFPKAEPLDYNNIKKIYDAQRKLLAAV